MNRFMPNFRRKQRLPGFTLIELTIATALATVLSLGLYAFIHAGTLVGVRSLAISNTGNVARNTVDKIDSLLQITYDIPVQIQKNGAKHTTADTPSAGIRFYRYGGGPYEVDIPSGGLSGNSRSLDIYARRGPSVAAGSTMGGPDAPPAPQPNDVLVINTTILMTGRANQIYAYVDKVTSTSTTTRKSSTGSNVPVTFYKVSLTQTLTDNNGMIPKGAVATVTAILIRPTAFVVVPNNDKRELRLYENFPEGTNLALNSPFTVLTDQVAWNDGGTPNSNDAFSTPFVVRKIANRTFVSTDLRVRNDRYDRFLKSSNRNEFSTFINLKSRIPVKCNPDE